MLNIFNNPEQYLQYLWKVKIDKNCRKLFDGKSMITVWLTKICNANCEHCFSRAPKEYDDNKKKEYQFSSGGIKKLIQFINESNCAYLMISGGGEPMFYKEAIYEIISKVYVERIVIVTNGVWGRDCRLAKATIDELYQRLSERDRKCELIIRVSIDRFHEKSLGVDMISNIFNIFNRDYANDESFQLMFHSIIGDTTMEKAVLEMPNACLETEEIINVSDSKIINKIIPKKKFLVSEHYAVPVGYAKLFYPDFVVDINNSDVECLSKIFDDDIINSEHGNPAVTFNSDGTVGLDFWIKYNGNVTTWGNQLSERNYNIYLDSYEKVKMGTLDNILSYSFLDKGYFYRENIIKEVNPQAVIRSKVIQLRNYSAALLLEENCTKLYYGLRVIQDYILEGVLKKEDICLLPDEMLEMLAQDKEKIISFYNQANYDIVDQYMNCDKKKNQKEWDMLFILIRNGHYHISPNHLDMAVDYYNQCFSKNITSIMDIENVDYDEFQERLAYVRKDVLDFLNNEM